MDTVEHTELGNALRFENNVNNPYLRVDANGILHLRLQRFSKYGVPEPMNLELSAGEVVALAGDYFTQADWTMHLNLPGNEQFKSSVDLGKYLIDSPVTKEEQSALITAYNNLASPDVTRRKINRIYAIDSAIYIPFFPTLNSYFRQLMFTIRVKDYGEMLIRNQTHFTPWSVKVYVLGHTIALHYARLAYEFRQLALSPSYDCQNPDSQLICDAQKDQPKDHLIELAHRFQAQAYSMELFTFHYYSDHFATGHMSVVGLLRVVLQKRFGTWGSILANNLHDEINRVGLFTSRPYDPTPNLSESPTRSRGDGKFDTCLNQFNKKECIAGMTCSLEDLHNVFNGKEIPAQNQYGGLEHMPDVDFSTRQHQPLLVLTNGRVYYRKHLSQIKILSPSEYEALRDNPEQHGYKELTSKWEAFKLVTKLRLFPNLYGGKVLPVSDEQINLILADEQQHNPLRSPIQDPLCAPEAQPNALDWRKATEPTELACGLRTQGIFASSHRSSNLKEKQPELSFGRQEYRTC